MEEVHLRAPAYNERSVAAAATVTSEELEHVLSAYVALPAGARRAVVSTVASFVDETTITAEERDLALALMALARVVN
jgi:hypothetical protein